MILASEIPAVKIQDAPSFLAIITAFVLVLIILNMPFRDPKNPNIKISPAFGKPAAELRSPEENITLWQFMSVSWMAPLISLGKSRQLKDVWSLSYEFQHRTLHNQFRELRGTVIMRLLEANGLDLFIISILSIIELVSSRCPLPFQLEGSA